MSRLKKFIEKIRSVCDAVLLIDTKNIYYFTGFYPHSQSYLLLTEDSCMRLLVPELEYEDARRSSKKSEVVNLKNEQPINFLVKNIKKLEGVKTLGFESEIMTVSTYLQLTKDLKSCEFRSISNILNEIKEVKTEKEIKFLEKSAEIADIGVHTAVNAIEEGKSENEIAGEVEYAMKKAGSQKIPFDTIIASGPNGAMPHATASERKIKRGDLIIIDLGATYKGYCSDMTRTVCFGKPTRKQREIYELVLKAHQNARDFAKAGVLVKDLDGVARELLESAGYRFIHSLGHGVGLDVHERPTISFKNENKLVENSIITIEPGIYIPEFGGVRIEDMYLVKKDRVIGLTKYEQEIFIQ
ncbi:MAG: M24 family metallopeptidase [Candidatus Helarchaeota archaeon]